MKKTFIIIYSIIVSLILIFALSFFGINLYNENQHGSLRTQVRFEKMAAASVTAMEKNGLSSSELLRQINNAIGDTKDFAYIKISNNNKTIYVYPQDFDNAENVQSKFVLKYNKTVNNNKIEAGLYSLRPGSIFNYAKTSFFIILIVTLITIILIIYFNHSDDKVKTSSVKKLKRPAPKLQEQDDEAFDETEEEIEEDDDEVTTEIEDESDIIQTEDEIIEEEAVEEVTEAPDYGSYEQIPEKIAELPTQDFEPGKINEDSTEKGLFSPETGFGWESYLLTRLENELNRATASELDLALFVIKINGIGRSHPVMKKICEYLTTEFQFKDLLFEYKDDSICALKISMSIDDAVTFGEKLVSEIKNIALEESPEVYIGITTRSIRMVTGERLLKEADEAVKHALVDKNCPVVGFRADAVKYRKFIETK